ncbi:interferon-induced very large GTPase 1-like [Acanthopagrus schlegelii]
MTLQKIADRIVMDCKEIVADKVERKNDYHDTYIQEILHLIDERLQNNHNVKTDIKFEVPLKQHICGFAARQFQKMHEDFLLKNDPYRCLNQNKVFHKRDQCQKKAKEFTEQYLRPAVEDFVKRSLGPDIIGEMKTRFEFRSQMFFQYSVLQDLLRKQEFDDYLNYIRKYDDYIKNWIHTQIAEHFSNGSTLFEFEVQHLKSSISSINIAINKAKTKKSGNLKTFVENVCQKLGDKLVISQDALGAFMILNNADQEQFAHWLTECVKDMEQDLREKFKETSIQMKLKSLHVNPQRELLSQMIGCGKQCPFCAAPCEAGGRGHTEHHASLHRPQGLGRYIWDGTKKLVTDICSSLVISDMRFRCAATNGEWHPYKRYTEIYPDWKIAPDASLQATDYWKYVLAKFNDKFAEAYNAKPADIPLTWKMITDKKAEDSLKKTFNIK